MTLQTPVLLAANPAETIPPGTTVHEYSMTIGGHSKAEFHSAKFEVAPHTLASPDRHDVRELWFVVEGQADLISDDQTAPLAPGMVYFFDSQVPHQISNTSNQPLKVITIWWPI